MRPVIRVIFPDTLPLKNVAPNVDEVTEPFDIWLELFTGKQVLLTTVERGFRTDGVSRPGLAAWWVKRWGICLKEAVLHDWLLELLRRGVISTPKYLIDLVFLMAMVANEVSIPRATIMFAAVRTKQ